MTYLSTLIVNLIDAKAEADAYFRENERNPYRTHPLEDRVADARNAVDGFVLSLRADMAAHAQHVANGTAP
jgi:hypothetical protein